MILEISVGLGLVVKTLFVETAVTCTMVNSDYYFVHEYISIEIFDKFSIF